MTDIPAKQNHKLISDALEGLKIANHAMSELAEITGDAAIKQFILHEIQPLQDLVQEELALLERKFPGAFQECKEATVKRNVDARDFGMLINTYEQEHKAQIAAQKAAYKQIHVGGQGEGDLEVPV